MGEQQIVSFSKDMNVTLEEVSMKMIELENEDKEQYTFKEDDTKKVVLPKTSVKIRDSRHCQNHFEVLFEDIQSWKKLRFGDPCNEPASWLASVIKFLTQLKKI